MYCPTNNYKACLQEQLILSKFKNFPSIVNVHRVFIDDKSDPYDPEWKRLDSELTVIQIMDHCPYGSLQDLVERDGSK